MLNTNEYLLRVDVPGTSIEKLLAVAPFSPDVTVSVTESPHREILLARCDLEHQRRA